MEWLVESNISSYNLSMAAFRAVVNIYDLNVVLVGHHCYLQDITVLYCALCHESASIMPVHPWFDSEIKLFFKTITHILHTYCENTVNSACNITTLYIIF